MINSIEYTSLQEKQKAVKIKMQLEILYLVLLIFFGEFISCLRQLINFRFCFYFTVRYETEILHKKKLFNLNFLRIL